MIAKNSNLKKAVHLLYVPTIFCNMGCKYCYLGNQTDTPIDTSQAIETLEYTLDKFTSNGYIPFNVSFHGGEVTTLPSDILEQLFQIAQNYYQEYAKEIKSLGHTINPLHVKTNLYNLEKHFDLFEKYKVSISGSIDLPLILHEKYRVDKKGRSTLDRIRKNLKLLATYPHNKKISCVVTREHMNYIDEFIDEIKYLHYDLKLNMEKFNVMFSFDSNTNLEKFTNPVPGTEMLTHDEQVIFYQRINEAFEGTELNSGLKNHWFKEFTPEYCCSATNCGDKFFLIQSDGEVFSCPRGQSSKQYNYGNIFKNEIEEIVKSGWKTIEKNENKLSINTECMTCEYFPYCNLGCTFVRSEKLSDKSYTCKLQKEIYKSDPEKYPAYDPEVIAEHVKKFMYRNKTKLLDNLETFPQKEAAVTEELFAQENAISEIIKRDSVLKELYADDLFLLNVGDEQYSLTSQILKNKSQIIFLDELSPVILYARKDIFSIATSDANEVNNYIHMMVLRNTPVVYGDEGRTKQEHLFDYSVYKSSFVDFSTENEAYYLFDLSQIFSLHKELFRGDVKNNLFFTTKSMRDYHYTKHRKNAFYHIQAINLPFSNIEFYWTN